MVNILSDLSLVQQWNDAFDGGADWDKLFADCQATVDWPGAFFYRELTAAYPEAKVLLSVRNGATWAQSMHDTIWAVLYGDSMIRDLSAARARVDPGWCQYIELMTAMWEKSGLLGPDRDSYEPTALAAAMERHNEEVRRSVPSERLLVWSPADGWEPLCEFLGLPVPQTPLPHVNDTATFADRLIEASLGSLVSWRERHQQALSVQR
jgi:hypothetical protein